MIILFTQNAGRILRGLFEIALRKGQPSLSSKLLTLCKCVDHRRWMFDHPLRQFSYDRLEQALTRLEEKKMTLERLRDMTADEIGGLMTALGYMYLPQSHFSPLNSLI